MDQATVAKTVLNNKFEVASALGEGKTAKVYLCKEIKNPKQQVAMKLVKEEFLNKNKKNIKCVEREIEVLRALQHKNIIQLIDFGTEGHVQKKSGRVLDNLTYILMEYVSGGLLYDFCTERGAMGEDVGRFFLQQMVDVVGYMHELNVVHRDLKLENILIDEDLNIKVADFGFSTYSNVDKLQSYKGTKTYMAPEIKEGLTYNGKSTDIFSLGVIIFIIVLGIFPFNEAKKDEYFYNLLHAKKYSSYWKKVGGEELSDDFKDLMQQIFVFDGDKRISLEDIKNHPFMTKTDFDFERTRQTMLNNSLDKKKQPVTEDISTASTAAG